MNYALIDNGIVTNIIWLSPKNADEFPNAIPYGNLPVQIGDTYEDGKFYRNGYLVQTDAEMYAEALAILGVTEE